MLTSLATGFVDGSRGGLWSLETTTVVHGLILATNLLKADARD